MSFNLTDYKLLSFDIYGTLIDWETGIFTALQPLLSQLPKDHVQASHRKILGLYSTHELATQKEQPKELYANILNQVYKRLAAELGLPNPLDEEASTFSSSIGDWPAYPDTVAAMQTLGEHYKLVALSNVDKASFSRTLAGPLSGVHFDAIYTAQDIGSYKPDLNNFEYLIRHVSKEFGIEKHEILHTANSLMHDHVPAKDIALQPGVWISRRGEGEKGSALDGDLEELKNLGKVNLGRVYETLGMMGEDAERAFARPE